MSTQHPRELKPVTFGAGFDADYRPRPVESSAPETPAETEVEVELIPKEESAPVTAIPVVEVNLPSNPPVVPVPKVSMPVSSPNLPANLPPLPPAPPVTPAPADADAMPWDSSNQT